MSISPALGAPARRLAIDLAPAYVTGDLVLVAGAGVSRAAGLPGWGEMVSSLQDRALSAIRPAANAQDLETVLAALHGSDPIARADSVMRLLQSKAFRLELQKALYPGSPAEYLPATAHWHLASLADRKLMPDLFTSNYDELLEIAKRSLRRSGRVRHFHGRLAQDWSGTRLADPPVVTSRDYLAADGRKRYEKLKAALKDKTVLLVGFSLSDPNLTRLIKDAAKDCRALVVATRGDLTPGQQALRLDLLLRYWRGLNVDVTAIEAREDLPAFLLALRREILRLKGESMFALGARALRASASSPLTGWSGGLREWRDGLLNAVRAAKLVAPVVRADAWLRAGFYQIEETGNLVHVVNSSSTRASMALPRRRLYAGEDGPWGAAGYAFAAGVPVTSVASGPAFDRNVPVTDLLAWQAERSAQKRLPAASVLCVPTWVRYSRRLVPVGVIYLSSGRASAFDDRGDAEQLRFVLSQTFDSMIAADRSVPGGLP